MMIFGNTTNRPTTCQFFFKQYNRFFTVQKHGICLFMETVPYGMSRLSIKTDLHKNESA